MSLNKEIILSCTEGVNQSIDRVCQTSSEQTAVKLSTQSSYMIAPRYLPSETSYWVGGAAILVAVLVGAGAIKRDLRKR